MSDEKEIFQGEAADYWSAHSCDDGQIGVRIHDEDMCGFHMPHPEAIRLAIALIQATPEPVDPRFPGDLDDWTAFDSVDLTKEQQVALGLALIRAAAKESR